MAKIIDIAKRQKDKTRESRIASTESRESKKSQARSDANARILERIRWDNREPMISSEVATEVETADGRRMTLRL